MKSRPKSLIKKLLTQGLISVCAIGGVSTAYAQAYQRFTNITYSNPAALNIVKQYQMIIGGAEIFLNSQFTGSYGSTPGSITSRTANFLPYGRLAMRLSPEVVIALDITQPLFLDFDYPRPSFIDRATIDTRLRDVDYSPRISWQATKKLALGIGLNFNNIYEALFTFRVAPNGTLTNRGSAWGTGWNVGLLYNPMLGTYAGLSYYSQIIQHVNGKSTWGTLTNNYNAATVLVPATINANLTQFVKRNWLFNANIRYTFWKPLRYLNIQNTALPGANKTVTIPEFFYNNFVYSVGTKYDFNDTWSGLGYVEINPNVQPLAYRGLGFVTSTAYIFGVGGEYAIQQGLKARFVYGHSFAHPQIHRQYSTGLALGRVNLVGNSFDLSITYDL
jgi:long-chain fatty acid transport protein